MVQEDGNNAKYGQRATTLSKFMTTQNLKLHAPPLDHSKNFCIISSQSNHEH